MLTFGERLKSAREEAGLAQGVVAKRVGFSQSNLSDLESGEAHSTTFVAEIAAVLGIEALWLSSGRGPKRCDGTVQFVSHDIPENVIALAQKLVLLPDEKINAISVLLGIKL
jgi:transcriptional regulator with XRE-family HTH domain